MTSLIIFLLLLVFSVFVAVILLVVKFFSLQRESMDRCYKILRGKHDGDS